MALQNFVLNYIMWRISKYAPPSFKNLYPYSYILYSDKSPKPSFIFKKLKIDTKVNNTKFRHKNILYIQNYLKKYNCMQVNIFFSFNIKYYF